MCCLLCSGCTAATEAAGEPEGRAEAVRTKAQEEGEGGQGVDQGNIPEMIDTMNG